jgi:Zn finger protein HypA/HybF involved in hydrogenase expression
VNPVDAPRERACIRCRGTFTERAGAVTRICDRCRGRDASAGVTDDAPGTIVGRRRERRCVRCDAAFVEQAGDVSCLCPACDATHLAE